MHGHPTRSGVNRHMAVSDESLRRLIRAYKEFYGEELSINEARAMASRIALLYERLAQPLPKETNSFKLPATGEDLPSSPR